jgi:hypothetical protein
MNLDMVPEYLLVLSITERTNHGSFISSDAVVGLGFESVLSKKERERGVGPGTHTTSKFKHEAPSVLASIWRDGPQ